MYAPNHLPDLLRIHEYEAAVVAADPAIRGDHRDASVGATTARQQVVLHGQQTKLVVVIGEAALGQQVSGADVLSKQLLHLAQLGGTEYPWIMIRVLPFGAGAHAAGGTGGFSILESDSITERAITHLDGPAGGLCLHEPAVTDAYVGTFWEFYWSAQSSTQSVRKIIQMSKR